MTAWGQLLGALGGMLSSEGGRFERNFDLRADEEGRVMLETELESPITGTLVGYSVQLQTGKAGREHATKLTVINISEPAMDLHVGPAPLVDFEEYEHSLTFHVRRGDRYLVRLVSDGFEPGEMVSGIAAARLKLG
jgi:hypothetical protein